MMSYVRLEPITKKQEELVQIAKWRNKTLISLRSTTPTPEDYQHQCYWVNSIQFEKYYFIYNETDFIGYCGLDKISKTNGTAELSLLIGMPFQGKRYGKQVVEALLEIAFNDLNLQCVFIEVYNTTDNWINFWHNLGFHLEGKLRRRKLWQGNYYSSIIASILKEEWIENGKLV